MIILKDEYYQKIKQTREHTVLQKYQFTLNYLNTSKVDLRLHASQEGTLAVGEESECCVLPLYLQIPKYSSWL